MSKKYTDIPIEEILDWEGPDTAKISRYERIMQHRTNEAMNGLSNRLEGVIGKIEDSAQTIQTASERMIQRADAAIGRADAATAEQRIQQRTTKTLTLALVGCTAVYTLASLFATCQGYKANAIQSRMAQTSHEQLALSRDESAATKAAQAKGNSAGHGLE